MKLYTFLWASIVISSSCNHIYYAPNTANAPLFSEKGETKINALYAVGGVSEFSGGELQAAHAVSKSFGVMINGMTAGRSDTWNDLSGRPNSYRNEKGTGSYFEFAGGYFKNFDQEKKWIGEVYSGIGSGSVKNDYDDGNSSKVNSFKFFVQPAVGYKSKYFEVAVIPKLSFINWNVKESHINGSTSNGKVEQDLAAINAKKSFTAFEPALLVRAGGRDIKFQCGLSFSNFTASSAFYSKDLIETLNASVGISINIKPNKN